MRRSPTSIGSLKGEAEPRCTEGRGGASLRGGRGRRGGRGAASRRSERRKQFNTVITAKGDCSQEIKITAPWKESYDRTRWCIKKQRNHVANKGPYRQTMVFPVVSEGCD